MIVFSSIALIFASLLFGFAVISTAENWIMKRTEDMASDIWSLIVYGMFFTTALLLFLRILNLA